MTCSRCFVIKFGKNKNKVLFMRYITLLSVIFLVSCTLQNKSQQEMEHDYIISQKKQEAEDLKRFESPLSVQREKSSADFKLTFPGFQSNK